MRYKDATHDWIWIPDAEAQKVIKHSSDLWRLPVKILYYYGLRATEVLRLTSENIKHEELVVQRLKHGLLTKQYLIPAVKDELLALVASKPAGSRLFPYTRKGLWQGIQDAGNRAGVDRVYLHPHAFRHACGRKWARMGTIAECGAMLGHRSLKATMMYTQLGCDVELSKKFLS
jgi:integrase